MSADPISSALYQVRGAGLLVDQLEVDGRVHRVDVEGQKRGKRAGWYICKWHRLDDGREIVVGAYGVWRGAENNAQRIRLDKAVTLTEAERERIKHENAALDAVREQERLARAKDAAVRAAEIWKGLQDTGRVPYLDRKGVRLYGCKIGRDGVLVVPLRNVAGLLVGLQFISADGSKKFLTGTAKKAAWHLIGTVTDEQPLVLAEGYATAASIHLATGWPVAVCFDCGNLLPVGLALRQLYPAAELLVAGDDDHQRADNPGRKAAAEAAAKLRGKMVLPAFQDANDRTDFNDLHAAEGLELVAAQLKASVTPSAQAGAETRSKQAWHGDLVFGRDGIKSIEHNVMLVLLNHPDWQGVFGYDEFAKRIVKRKAPPYVGRTGPLRDVDEIEIAAWFGRPDTFAAGITPSVARNACIAVAERFPFHPVREYLDTLKWDGEPRLESFFSDFCGAEQNPVTAAFGRNFFVQAVARIFLPGCKADLMLVLEGEQGARKSTLAKVLAGNGFYADVGTSPSDKDFFQIIQGCWLVEISEMASFARAESAHIKRAISVDIDRFRKSYGHNVEEFKRECVFFGTVNNSDWQRDETGGRRFMPVWVQDINIEGVRDVRDQLWAEAVHRFRLKETWYELPAEAREQQDLRYTEDIWLEAIYRWLEGRAGKDRYQDTILGPIVETTASEILARALDVERKKQDRAMQMRVGNLMRRLGWRRKQKRLGATRVWVFHRPPAPTTGAAPPPEASDA